MGVLEIAKGMGITLGKLFTRPVTVSYPEQPAHLQSRFRGRHILTRHANGLEKCIGCSLCAAACPSYAIYVEAAENTPEKTVSAGERYASVYEINMLRCIFCGLCEEACPTGAVIMGTEFEMADYRSRDMVYGKEDMIVGVEGSKSQRREAALKSKPVKLGYTITPRREVEEALQASKNRSSAVGTMPASGVTVEDVSQVGRDSTGRSSPSREGLAPLPPRNYVSKTDAEKEIPS
jgi:NADH-quinone oxidoreductase subunit I